MKTNLNAVWNGLATIGSCALVTISVAGCRSWTAGLTTLSPSKLTALTSPGLDSVSARAVAASESLTISNPPAKQIRFDGQERLLGAGTCHTIPPDIFRAQIRDLLAQQKNRSAISLIGLHERAAQELLVRDLSPSSPELDLIAQTLDRGSHVGAWTAHRQACQANPHRCLELTALRQKLEQNSSDNPPLESLAQQLVATAETIGSQPLTLEAQRLQALALFSEQHTDDAIAVLVNSAETATQQGLPRIAADLWMLACEASLQKDFVDQARKCWTAGVANQLVAIRQRAPEQLLPAVDTVFWEQADRLIHPEDQFPQELSLVFAPWYSRLGISHQIDEANRSQLPPRVALWAALAQFQLSTGQPHLATLSLKRAEQDASAAIRPWLQITSARALAAQNQDALAAAILGNLLNNPNPNIAAAAMATWGSIKIQSGAYEQGSNFLISALNHSESQNWPGALAAKADLANVWLIVGRLDEALPELHAVQNEMLIAGNWQSLIRSLENEAAILEAEKMNAQAEEIRRRIAQIERG